jgi:hypothetical protein
LQAPPGRVASGEKISVISFGTQQQQQHQYRSVHIYITIIVITSSSSSSSCSDGGDAGSLTINLLFWAYTLGSIFYYGQTKSDEMGETSNKQGDTNVLLETHEGTDCFEDVYRDGRTTL